MPDIVSFPLLGFTLAIKVRNFDFESRWNTLTKKYMMSDLNIFHEKMSDFVSFPLFGFFTLVMKLRILDNESHWNALIFFYEKNDGRFG